MKHLKEQVGLIPWIGIVLFSFLFLSACQSLSPADLPTAVVEQLLVKSQVASTPSPEIEPLVETTPSKERDAPVFYLVKESETLSNISARFDISPQTLLWANYAELFDNPDYLLPGMELLVLPTNGVYHQVGGNDTLLSLAAFFGVEASAITDWPGNNLDAQNTTVQTGQWLMVPGGQRASRWRQMPNVARQNATLSAEEFGSGACEANFTDDLLGDGDYAWPLANVKLGAETFQEWHQGVDLAVEIGQEVLAADHGVVVFSGWSNLGYGNLLMIDHGLGNFSLYSGFSSPIAACGHTIRQGDVIAEAGATGHPAGPILHFEIRSGSDFLDPFSLISTP